MDRSLPNSLNMNLKPTRMDRSLPPQKEFPFGRSDRSPTSPEQPGSASQRWNTEKEKFGTKIFGLKFLKMATFMEYKMKLGLDFHNILIRNIFLRTCKTCSWIQFKISKFSKKSRCYIIPERINIHVLK